MSDDIVPVAIEPQQAAAVVNPAPAAQAPNQLVQYVTDMSFVERLNPDTVRTQLVRGNGRVNDQEVAYFIDLCKARRLNPFINEAYLVKYGDSPASTIVALSVFEQRAEAHPDFNGKSYGVVVVSKDAQITERRKGAIVYPGEVLVGGWCEVKRKSWEVPEYVEVAFSEYTTGKSTWKSKPATMIVKVAKVQALRAAFPREFGGMYTGDEMDSSAGERPVATVTATPKPVQQPTVAAPTSPPVLPAAKATDAQVLEAGRLFRQLGLDDAEVDQKLAGVSKLTENDAARTIDVLHRKLAAAQAQTQDAQDEAIAQEDLTDAPDIPF